MLNVAGFHNKLELAIFDQYLAEFDICLVEANTYSSHLHKSLPSDFLCIPKKKISCSRKYKYGGIHGICTIVNPSLRNNIEVIPDTESECVLWFKLKMDDNFTGNFGAVISHVIIPDFILMKFLTRSKVILLF